MTGNAECMGLDRVAIAQLEPSLEGSEKVVKGVVTLIWPYSASNKSFSVLLAEPDFRLRRQRGQVRVHFTGPSAKVVSRCDPQSGDHFILHLLGAQWEKDETLSRTPGRGIEWQLRFEQRLSLQIQRENQELVQLDLDHPVPSPEPQIRTPPPSETTPILQFAPTPSFPSAVPSRVQAWSTPAFLKRDRLSTTTFFGSDYDPFDDDEFRDNNRRKKTKFGRASDQWRFTEQSPSPDSIPDPSTPVAEQPAVNEPRSLLVNGHKDIKVLQGSNDTDTEREESVASPSVPEGPERVTNDLLAVQIPPNINERRQPSISTAASQGVEPATVDEGVQTLRSGSEPLEHPYQEGEIIGNQEPAEGITTLVAPDRDRMDLVNAENTNENVATDSSSLRDEEGHDAALSDRPQSEVHDAAELDNGKRPDAITRKAVTPTDESREGTPSPSIGQPLDERFNERQVPTEDWIPPESINDQGYQKYQIAEAGDLHGRLESSNDTTPEKPPRAKDNSATFQMVDDVGETQASLDQAQEPSTGITDQAEESRGPKSTEALHNTEWAQGQILPINEESHISMDTSSNETQKDNHVGVSEAVQNDESKDLSMQLDTQPSHILKDYSAREAETSPFLQDQGIFPGKVSPTKFVEEVQEQAEVLEILSEGEETESSLEEDNIIDNGRQRLPGEAEIMEEAWASEEDGYPSDENLEAEEFDNDAEDLGYNKQKTAAVSRTSEVEVIALDDSDEDDSAVAQSQTDGAAISVIPDRRRPSQTITVSSPSRKGELTIHPSPPLLPSTVQDSQHSFKSVGPEPSAEEIITQSDRDSSFPHALEYSGDGKLKAGLYVNDLEINGETGLQPTSPDDEVPIEDDIDPRLKNRILTPNDTQPREEPSQASEISLQSIHDTHDLPTPQLTQNRSSDTLLPAALRPSSPAIPTSSPPASPAKSSSPHRIDEVSTLVDHLPRFRDGVHASPKQSLRSRRVSDIPVSISPWFAPKRSSGVVPDSRSQSEAENEQSVSSSSDEEEAEVEDVEEEESPSILEPSTEPSISERALISISTPSGKPLPSFPSRTPTGLRTSHAYYAPLSTLSSHFDTTTSTLSIVLAATPIARANSGPRDFYTTIFVTDPSSLASSSHDKSTSPSATPLFTTTSIFRPNHSSLPSPLTAGSVLLLRSFTVTSTNRTTSLLISNASAWAVFQPHNPDPIISGPPVEFGADERGYVRGLWE
ncbi:MAG: hypothetical protein Q9225_006912, partial [Loekoesia sp. 1 TL-2023]